MENSGQPEGAMAATAVNKEGEKGDAVMLAAVVLGHAIKHVYLNGFQAIIFPEIKSGLGLSNTLLGGLATAQRAAGGIATPGAGYLGDRYSRHAGLFLAVSLGLLGVSYLLVGSTLNYWLMCGAMLLAGLSPSLYHPPALGALSRRFPDRRGFVISLHGAGGSIGNAIGPLVAAAAVGAIAWRATLRWSVLPILAAAAIVWLMMRSVPMGERGTSSTRDYFGSVGTLLRERAMVAILAISGLRSLAQSAIVLFLPVYLREDLEYSLARVAIYLSLSQVAGIGAAPIMGALSDRFGRKAVLGPAMVTFAILLVALKLVASGPWLVAVIICIGAFSYSFQALFVAAASDLGGRHVQATTASLAYTVGPVAGTISPVIAGLVADAFGVSSTFLYAAALLLMGSVALALVRLPQVTEQAVVAQNKLSRD